MSNAWVANGLCSCPLPISLLPSEVQRDAVGRIPKVRAPRVAEDVTCRNGGPLQTRRGNVLAIVILYLRAPPVNPENEIITLYLPYYRSDSTGSGGCVESYKCRYARTIPRPLKEDYSCQGVARSGNGGNDQKCRSQGRGIAQPAPSRRQPYDRPVGASPRHEEPQLYPN